MALFRKKPTITYDPAAQEPALRRSICTGEMTLGFIDRDTGKFHDCLCVRTQEELETLCRELGVEAETIRTIY